MNRVRILLLGFYYPPDISAGAFRAEALVTALERRLPQGSELHVITTMPNRHRHEVDLLSEEEALPGGKVRITRLPVAGGGRGMASQVRAFASYAHQVYKRVRAEPYDLVVSTSSRLMTAVLGSWIARRKNARLYQDIRDNFVENLSFVLPGGVGRVLAPLFGLLERWALGRADRINLVSRGFEPYFRARYPRKRFTWHTNGIDSLFVDAFEAGSFQPVYAERESQEERPLRVLYAGNLGFGQGIEHILPPLAKRLAGRAEFRVIGGGAGRESLCRVLTEHGVGNVQVQDPVRRPALLEAYREADVLFLHLNALPSLENVLPSKLFEYATTGRPIWAGVAGFPARFIEEEINNAVCFPPCEVEGAIAALGRLEVSSRPRTAFVAKWRRDRIMSDMADDILALVK